MNKESDVKYKNKFYTIKEINSYDNILYADLYGLYGVEDEYVIPLEELVEIPQIKSEEFESIYGVIHISDYGWSFNNKKFYYFIKVFFFYKCTFTNEKKRGWEYINAPTIKQLKTKVIKLIKEKSIEYDQNN